MSMECHHYRRCLSRSAGIRVRTTLLLGLAPLAVTASAWGQEAPLAVEEIIVTAERRAADLQDVPIAITAMTGEQLDRSGIQSTQDLQARTPGLVFTTNAS
jgi:iron complex outermembrane recepter protein